MNAQISVAEKNGSAAFGLIMNSGVSVCEFSHGDYPATAAEMQQAAVAKAWGVTTPRVRHIEFAEGGERCKQIAEEALQSHL